MFRPHTLSTARPSVSAEVHAELCRPTDVCSLRIQEYTDSLASIGDHRYVLLQKIIVIHENRSNELTSFVTSDEYSYLGS